MGWGVKRGKGQGQVGDRWAPCNNHSRGGGGLTAILCKTGSLAANSLGIEAKLLRKQANLWEMQIQLLGMEAKVWEWRQCNGNGGKVRGMEAKLWEWRQSYGNGRKVVG